MSNLYVVEIKVKSHNPKARKPISKAYAVLADTAEHAVERVKAMNPSMIVVSADSMHCLNGIARVR